MYATIMDLIFIVLFEMHKIKLFIENRITFCAAIYKYNSLKIRTIIVKKFIWMRDEPPVKIP